MNDVSGMNYSLFMKFVGWFNALNDAIWNIRHSVYKTQSLKVMCIALLENWVEISIPRVMQIFIGICSHHLLNTVMNWKLLSILWHK